MRIDKTAKYTLFAGFLIGVASTIACLNFINQPSYEDCILEKVSEIQSDHAARLLNIVCKKTANKPRYDFSKAINPFTSSSNQKLPRGYVFENE